jgi:hypothetical protein
MACSLLGFGCLTITGCGGSSTANTSNERSDAGLAYQPVVVESQGSAPQQTVGIFLDSLRRGDESTANSLLTTKGQQEVQKTTYKIQPLGTPEGEFKIGRLGFPYEDKTVALVECQWREPATKTEPELQMDIVCEVRQETQGWRISGMAVTVLNDPTTTGDPETLVIDFEDGARLQQMLDSANGPAQPSQIAGQSVGQPQLGANQVGQSALPFNQQATNQFAQPTVGNQFNQSVENQYAQPSAPGALPPLPNGNLPPLPNNQPIQPSNTGTLALPPNSGPALR